MALFNLGAFIHALNIYNLTKGNAPEELYVDQNAEQNTQMQVNCLKSQHNAEMLYLETQQKQRKAEVDDTNNACRSLAYFIADRLALHHAVLEVERGWEMGAIVSIACVKASELREKAFRRLIDDKWEVEAALDGLKSNFRNDKEGIPASMQALQISRHHAAPNPAIATAALEPGVANTPGKELIGLIGLAVDADRNGLAQAADHIEKCWAAGGDIKTTFAEAADIRRQAYCDHMEENCIEGGQASAMFSSLTQDASLASSDWEHRLVRSLPLSRRKTSYYFVQSDFY